MLTSLMYILFSATQASACAVCGIGEDPAAGAILAGTGLLSAAPIIMIGSGVYYLYRQSKKHRPDDLHASAPSLTAESSPQK